MNLAVTLNFSNRAAAFGIERALEDASALVHIAETHALTLAELGAIELPPAAQADPMQLRAVASLYLASALEAAGLIEAADDLTRLARSGALSGDLGQAAALIEAFWDDRNHRPSLEERQALFARLFGAPAGPVDTAGGPNREFDELLLDLCDAIMATADGEVSARLRAAGERLAENVAGVANDMLLLMAREIIASLSKAVAILNHPAVRALLGVRTLWEAVSAIDRRFRRRARPTLNHLRRGRAGMAVLSWLADARDDLDRPGSLHVAASDPVVEAAIDWVDETLSIIRAAEAPGGRSAAANPALPADNDRSSWLDLAR